MSQGDQALNAGVSQPRQALSDSVSLHNLIRAGRSFSGHERNVCFLNTGTPRFADISSIANLDLPDDGRGMALVDWDQDGDLDVWIANRSGPQIRFLRNQVPTAHHYVTFQLVGTTCNRDAIGARVRVATKTAAGPQVQLRTLRAGDGYLSQSSKWLHFGLGVASQVESIEVDWPGGETETFASATVDGRYRLTQGAGRVEVLPTGERPIHLASVLEAAERNPRGLQSPRLLSAPVPLPRLEYRTLDDETRIVAANQDRPLLVNLWATWCQPCWVEIADFAAHQSELEQAGVDVLLLNVDEFTAENSVEVNGVAERLARLESALPAGRATESLLDKLQIVDDQVFDRRTPWSIPCSLLIVNGNELAAIYKASIHTEQLLRDVAKLSLDDNARRMASVPFTGRWLAEAAQISLVPMFHRLLQEGYREDAIDLLTRYRSRFPDDIATAEPLLREGVEKLRKGDADAARLRFQQALELDPDNVDAHFQLGRAYEQLKQIEEAQRAYEATLARDANHEGAHFALALLQQAAGQTREASQHLRQVLVQRPDHLPSLFHLSRLLATDLDDAVRDGALARKLAEQAVTITRGEKAEVVAVLAAAQAETGDTATAAMTAERALQVAHAAGDASVVPEIEQQLKMYQRGQPWRRAR